MTADVKLLPLHSLEAFSAAMKGERGELDAWLEVNNEADVRLHVEAYARAYVSRATAARDAELVELRSTIEALRAEAYTAHEAVLYHIAERAKIRARAERLAEALREARDCIEDWAGYASDYFREKHDLAGDLAKIDALLREQEEGRADPA